MSEEGGGYESKGAADPGMATATPAAVEAAPVDLSALAEGTSRFGTPMVPPPSASPLGGPAFSPTYGDDVRTPPDSPTYGDDVRTPSSETPILHDTYFPGQTTPEPLVQEKTGLGGGSPLVDDDDDLRV